MFYGLKLIQQYLQSFHDYLLYELFLKNSQLYEQLMASPEHGFDWIVNIIRYYSRELFKISFQFHNNNNDDISNGKDKENDSLTYLK
eukprot:gene11764-15742_t